MREINNAYDAYWFLFYHPALMLTERHEVPAEEAGALEAEGFLVARDKGGKCWRLHRHVMRHAIDVNLDIHYAKVDPETRTVEDDASRNTAVECWLEFGPLEWGYMAGGVYDWDTETALMHYHDTDLDCGAGTFDEALVELAGLVLGKYGDYEDKNGRQGECGRPVCADCGERKRIADEVIGP